MRGGHVTGVQTCALPISVDGRVGRRSAALSKGGPVHPIRASCGVASCYPVLVNVLAAAAAGAGSAGGPTRAGAAGRAGPGRRAAAIAASSGSLVSELLRPALVGSAGGLGVVAG